MKKFFAALLAMIMVLSLVPATIFAADVEACPGVGKEHNKNNCPSYTEVKVVEAGAKGEYGYTIYECNDCAEQFVADFVEGADCAHTWDDGKVDPEPTCDEEGVKTYTCTACKATKTESVPALGHKYETVDGIGCAEKQVCTECGAEKEVGEHKWGLYPSAVLEEPYFDELGGAHDGLAEYTCELCGDVKHVIIICEHEHKVTEIPGKAANCYEAGYEVSYECSVCKKLFADEAATKQIDAAKVIEALGHDWSEPTVKPGSCIEFFVCEREGCGATKATEGDEIKHTKYQHILTVEATCTQYGFELWGCTNCGMTKVESVTAPLNHKTQKTVTVPSTCTYPGYTFTYCAEENCDVYDEVSTVTTGKGLYRIDGEGKAYFNGYDVTVDGKPVKLISIADTAIVEGWHDLVADADDLDGDGDKKELVPGNTVYTIVQKPGCYSSGIGVWTCVLCGFNKAQTAPAAHTWGEWTETAPSCETEGSKTRSCTVCQKTETSAIDAAGHVYKELFHRYTCISTTEADGTVWVEKIHMGCVVCGDYYFDYVTVEESGIYTENYFESEAAAAAVHGTWVVATTYKQDKDGNWVVDTQENEQEPTHNFRALEAGEEGYVYNASTCTEHGFQSYICEDCGYKFFIQLPFAAHTTEKEENFKAEELATCYFDGVKAHAICDDCGATHINGNAVTAADLVIPAGHGKMATIAKVDSKCEEGQLAELPFDATAADRINALLAAGYGLSRDVKYCTVCGDAWDGNNQLFGHLMLDRMSLDLYVFPAHNLVTYEGTAPTCQQDGTLGYEYCTKCEYVADSVLVGTIMGGIVVGSVDVDEDGNLVIEPVVLPALGHKTVAYITAGFQIKVVNGEKFVIPTIIAQATESAVVEVDANNPACLCNAIGHHSCTKITYAHYMCELCDKEWIDHYAPAAEKHLTEDGKELSCGDVCGTCGYVAADHVWNDTHETVEPTCQEYGYSYIYCTVCGERKVTNIIPAGDEYHDYKVNETTGLISCTICGDIYDNGCLVITPSTDVESVTDGTVFTVEIVINASDLAVWGYRFDIGYEADVLELVEAKIVSKSFTYAGKINDMIVSEDDYNCGVISVALNAEDDVVVNAEEVVVEATFKVNNLANRAETCVWTGIYDESKGAPAVSYDGEIVDCIYGEIAIALDLFLDVDKDGVAATMLDALAMYDMILAGATVEDCPAADADADGVITMSDLLVLYDVIVGATSIDALLGREPVEAPEVEEPAV